MNNQRGDTAVYLLLGLLAAIIIGIIIWVIVAAHGNWVKDTTAVVDVKVTEKERIFDDGEQSSKYLVFTENEVFENTDSWYHQKYNSSDVYGQLRVGKEYTCEVYGQRNPRWSWYRNIVSCEEKK